MKAIVPGSFGAQLKALRETAGFTQEELATIAGLSIHAVSALERGERRRPHVETVRALSAALDLTGAARDALLASARTTAHNTASDELSMVALPVPLTALLGRDADLQTLRQWLGDPAVRLITLIGPGGAGKTRLALEIAQAIAAEGAARVLFVPLATIPDPAYVASAIGEALGLSDVTALDLPKRAQGACAGHPTLLVLDNFEHVLASAPLLADLLASVASLSVLVTSRASLRLRGEREYSVGPLSLDVDVDAIALADLARSPAVRLFVERVRDVQPDFHLTAANSATVTGICRRLDALPLALELTARWIKVLTPEDLLRRLTHDVLPSTVGQRDLPERQQTMNATVAWSYQLLDPDDQQAFRRFGALTGRFPIDAAAAVLGGHEDASARSDQALRTTAGLIDKSLLLRAETSSATRPLYQMLETVRAYAALQLAAAGERDDALKGLAHYCVREASAAAEGLVGPAQAEWLDRVYDDLGNYRCTLSWLIECGRSAEASDIACGLMWFWVIRGHATEGLRWYEQILNLPSLPPHSEIRARASAAQLSYTQGDLERAIAGLNRVLTLARSLDDLATVAQTENLFGHIERKLGDLNAARDRFTRSVEIFRALAIPWGTASALNGLAIVALAAGDVGRAERLLDEATLVLRNAGPWFLTLGAYIRGVLAVRRGNADEAIALMRESLAGIRELHDKFAFVYALVPLAAAAVLKGDDAWAARIMGARDAVTDRTGATVADRFVNDLREQSEREARARLGPDRWARAYAAGRGASFDSLMNDIDRVL